MNKIVINLCHGGFNLSDEAMSLLEDKLGKPFDVEKLPRHNKELVEVVEELGEDEASGLLSDLCVVEIKGSKYIITNYDGEEDVKEPQDIQWIEIKE